MNLRTLWRSNDPNSITLGVTNTMAIQLNRAQHCSVLAGERPVTGGNQYYGRGITTLPGEILVKIFTHLSAWDLLACGQVNRRWQSIMITNPALARAFCRGLQPLTPIPLPLSETTVENYHTFIRDQLEEFGEAGHRAVIGLDQALAQGKSHFPERLCFALAQVLNGAKMFYGTKIHTFKHRGTITSTCLSADEHTLATTTGDTVNICRQVDREWRDATTFRHSVEVHSTRFSRDGNWLAVAGKNHITFLYRVVDHQWQRQTTVWHYCHWFTPCFTADGQYLVTAATRHIVWLHRLIDQQWQRLHSPLDEFRVHNTCLHPWKNLLVTSAIGIGRVAIWRLTNAGAEREYIFQESVGMATAHFSASGNRLLLTSACSFIRVQIWHDSGQSWKRTDNFQLLLMDRARFSVGEHYLLAYPISVNQSMTIVPIGETKWPKIILPASYKVSEAHFNLGEDRLLTISRNAHDKSVELWRCVDGVWQVEAVFPHTATVLDACFSFYGDVMTASADQAVKIWGHDGERWCKKATLRHSKWVTALTISPLGRYVFTISGNKTVAIWLLSGNTNMAEQQRQANTRCNLF